jgi:hypothetical protein
MGDITSAIAPAIGLGGKAANAIGGGKTNSSTPSSLSPQQAALAEFTMGQQMLNNNSKFASSGTGLSTMKTLSNAGAQIGGATEAAGLADKNAAAAQAANASLTNLASSAGFGSTGGNFGSTGGSFDTGGDINPTPGS